MTPSRSPTSTSVGSAFSPGKYAALLPPRHRCCLIRDAERGRGLDFQPACLHVVVEHGGPADSGRPHDRGCRHQHEAADATGKLHRDLLRQRAAPAEPGNIDDLVAQSVGDFHHDRGNGRRAIGQQCVGRTADPRHVERPHLTPVDLREQRRCGGDVGANAVEEQQRRPARTRPPACDAQRQAVDMFVADGRSAADPAHGSRLRISG